MTAAAILLAEDSPEISAFLVDFLTLRGHRVEAVADGLALARRAAESLPQLIITDVQMPGAYGSNAYEALQDDARTRKIPVIFISAHPLGAMMPKDPKVRFLQKPVDLKRLDALIAELLPPEGERP